MFFFHSFFLYTSLIFLILSFSNISTSQCNHYCHCNPHLISISI